MHFVWTISILICCCPSQEKTVNFQVWNGYSMELYRDSIWIYPGTLFEESFDESVQILLPDDDGVYQFETSKNGFHLYAGEGITELEIKGLDESLDQDIWLDSLTIFPIQGRDTITTTIWTKRKFLWHKWNSVNSKTEIQNYGNGGFLIEELPNEIRVFINGQKKVLTQTMLGSNHMTGHGANEKGRRIDIQKNHTQKNVWYTNTF